jgi:signal recognition particle receptor subunit beta
MTAPSAPVEPPAPPPSAAEHAIPARPSAPVEPQPASGRGGPPSAPVSRNTPARGAAPAVDPAPDPAADAARAERMRRLVARSSAPTVAPVEDSPAAPPARRVEAAATPSPAPPVTAAAPAAPVPAASPVPPTVHAPVARTVPFEPDGDQQPSTDSFTSIIQVAERSGRTDLSTRLREHREDIRRTGVTIVVVGEFKKGKSTLVNSLVNAEICPADPVYASVAPVVVSHAEEYTVTTTYASGRQESAPLDAVQLADVASEEGNEANHLGLLRVEVTLPRRLLAAGLHLVDMPGVGGLDSAIGALNLASLDAADGVVFVTDCTQELTAPELAFAVAAKRRCPAMVCVMTKVDLQHDATAILAKNRAHLDAHGLEDVPLHAVSSVLHLVALAQGDPVLEAESGFGVLFDALHTQMWEPARRKALADAGRRLADLSDHVALPIEAERRALASPAEAERIITRMTEMEDRVRQLRSASARWQQRLAEGAADITNDLDHELRERFRSVGRMAEARADTEGGDDLAYESWLHKATMDAVLTHYDRIGERMSALSDEIAGHFLALDRNASLQVRSEAPASRLAGLSIAKEAQFVKDGVLRRLVTTSQGYSSGMVLTSSLFGFFAGPFLLVPVVTLPIAGLMARKAFVDDRDRKRNARRVELKRLSNRYLDEVGFVVYKDSRDAIKRVHRELRDHYAERAERLERTLRQAREAAELARRRSADAAGGGAASLERAAHAVEQVQSAAARLVAVGPGVA